MTEGEVIGKFEEFKKAIILKNETIANLTTQNEGLNIKITDLEDKIKTYEQQLGNLKENPFSEKVENAIKELDELIK